MKCWSLLKDYIQWLNDKEQSPFTINGKRRVVKKAIITLKEKDPRTFDDKDIRLFLSPFEPGRTRKFYRTYLNDFLKFCGNHVIASMTFNDPKDNRVNVRWLTESQISRIKSTKMTSREEIVISFAMDFGLRRSAIQRIRINDIDIHNEVLTVRSKGNVLRTIPFPPDFNIILDRWLNERDRLISKHGVEDPGTLLIVYYRGELKPPERTTLDEAYISVSDKVGFHFSFHDLRRTWARTAWEIGIPIESIAQVLGHRDTKTTLRYIGAEIKHTREAMQKMYAHRSGLNYTKQVVENREGN